MNVLRILQLRMEAALKGLTADPNSFARMVKPVQDPRHGDYQANCAMSLAKVLATKPRDLAARIVERLQLEDIAEPPEIAGPGFINIRLRKGWLADQIRRIGQDERLGIAPADEPKTIVIDYSSPNVAKPMHVGHLRSTIIGDALARLFRFLGHRVVTDNHLGDWGTQFGILLYGYKNFRDQDEWTKDPVREMARIYVLVRDMMKEAEAADDGAEVPKSAIAQAARDETAKLHAGDPENRELWEKFMPFCREEIDRLYRRLDVHFDVTLGESFYNPMLGDVVRNLESKGIAKESQGAIAIFFDDEAAPALIRKKDGAFTYTTTDLATIQYRTEKWRPDLVLYVVDSRQSLVFKNLFEIVRRWGVTQARLEHVAFGSVLGPDGKPIKTREGGAVELGALLDEAVQQADRAYEAARQERVAAGDDVPDLQPDDRRQLAEAIGIGAVKYADLSQNRNTDYVFSWEKMLAMDGNTATYMQYVYARIQSIFRKGDEDPHTLRRQGPEVILDHPSEKALALELLRCEEALQAAAAELKPNAITAYLWDLAKSYNSFYQSCRVLKAESPALRRSRLLLCDLTARTIALGLQILGIRTVDRM